MGMVYLIAPPGFFVAFPTLLFVGPPAALAGLLFLARWTVTGR
jgi:hypothetical protein